MRGGKNGYWMDGEEFGGVVTSNSYILKNANKTIKNTIEKIPDETTKVEIEWERIRKIALKRKEHTYEASLHEYLNEIL